MEIREREKEILDYWEHNKINDGVRKLRSNGKKFYFLDGPPYVTGELGTHHIWVETIKDLILRYKRFKGFAVHDRAGFDVHGLPIEFKVEKRVEAKSKADIEQRIGIDAFVSACKEYAKEQSVSAIATFKRFGSSLDFENVYMPYDTSYISKGWFIFKEMYSKGLLYRELQPLSYCPRCETVLSAQGPEVEYADETDPSIFVTFKVDNQKSRSAKVKFEDDTYFVVWTTTPWTLPANVAIAANPKEVYVCVASEGKNYILTKSRLDAFTEATGISNVLTSEFYGSELEGVRFLSPLKNEIPMQSEIAKYHKVILSESFVSVSEGTGLLHVAPGHGSEDYKLGKQNKLPIISPVDAHARFTEQAGSFRGLLIPSEANDSVLGVLKVNGSLLFQGKIRHSYPHCWRCSTKLITRSTEQWFIKVQKIKKRMLSENQKVTWHPADASGWFADAVESSPDWCVSRQRYWGAPLPIWICQSCNKMEVIGSIEELKQRAGLAALPADLHRPHVDMIKFKCECSGEMKRVADVFDVWYDSGISHTASLKEGEFERLFPADWITESRDQIRGWFTVLLRTGVAVYGKTPFKRVNIGGMLKDELGQEMHRHLGNTINANELHGIVSADGFRLWCSSHPRWLELKLKKIELEEADSNIMTLYNIAQLVGEFAQLAKIDIKGVTKPPSQSRLTVDEKWILSRLNSLIGSSTEKLDDYRVDEAVKEIRDFILEDLSRFYLKFAKQRTELANASTLRRIATLNAYLLRKVIVLAAPIIPFTSEYIYQHTFSVDGKSVFTESWPKQAKKLVDAQSEKDFELLKDIANSALYLREQGNVKLRWPIKEVVVETSEQQVISSLARIAPLIEMYANAKAIKLIEGNNRKKEVRPLFAKLGPDFKQNAGTIAQELKEADGALVEAEIMKSGIYRLHTSKGVFEIKPEHMMIIEKSDVSGSAPFKYGTVSIDATQTDEMKKELMIREVTRRIQMMRKESRLTKMDRIELLIIADSASIEILKSNSSEIKEITRAKKLELLEKTDVREGFFQKNWNLLGSEISIGIKKI